MPIAFEKNFHIFNSKYRSDNQPEILYPILKKPIGKGESSIEFHNLSEELIIFPETDYYTDNWKVLLGSISLYTMEENNTAKQSKNSHFSYIDIASPTSEIQSIHIEHISSWNFMNDIEKKMKVVNIGVRISDFKDDYQKAANLVLMDILIRENFIPTAVFDLKWENKRVRVANFLRVKEIKLEAKFELLDKYSSTFEIFDHDCKVQGLIWPKVVNIIPVEKLIKDKQALTFNSDFNFIPKGSFIHEVVSPKLKIELELNNSAMFSKLHSFIEQSHKSVNIFMHTEKYELELETLKNIEKAMGNIPDYIKKFDPIQKLENHTMFLNGQKYSIQITEKKDTKNSFNHFGVADLPQDKLK